jgi:hypothetical protein
MHSASDSRFSADLFNVTKLPTKLTTVDGMIITTLLKKGLLNPSFVAASSVTFRLKRSGLHHQDSFAHIAVSLVLLLVSYLQELTYFPCSSVSIPALLSRGFFLP